MLNHFFKSGLSGIGLSGILSSLSPPNRVSSEKQKETIAKISKSQNDEEIIKSLYTAVNDSGSVLKPLVINLLETFLADKREQQNDLLNTYTDFDLTTIESELKQYKSDSDSGELGLHAFVVFLYLVCPQLFPVVDKNGAFINEKMSYDFMVQMGNYDSLVLKDVGMSVDSHGGVAKNVHYLLKKEDKHSSIQSMVRIFEQSLRDHSSFSSDDILHGMSKMISLDIQFYPGYEKFMKMQTDRQVENMKKMRIKAKNRRPFPIWLGDSAGFTPNKTRWTATAYVAENVKSSNPLYEQASEKLKDAFNETFKAMVTDATELGNDGKLKKSDECKALFNSLLEGKVKNNITYEENDQYDKMKKFSNDLDPKIATFLRSVVNKSKSSDVIDSSQVETSIGGLFWASGLLRASTSLEVMNSVGSNFMSKPVLICVYAIYKIGKKRILTLFFCDKDNAKDLLRKKTKLISKRDKTGQISTKYKQLDLSGDEEEDDEENSDEDQLSSSSSGSSSSGSSSSSDSEDDNRRSRKNRKGRRGGRHIKDERKTRKLTSVFQTTELNDTEEKKTEDGKHLIGAPNSKASSSSSSSSSPSLPSFSSASATTKKEQIEENHKELCKSSTYLGSSGDDDVDWFFYQGNSTRAKNPSIIALAKTVATLLCASNQKDLSKNIRFTTLVDLRSVTDTLSQTKDYVIYRDVRTDSPFDILSMPRDINTSNEDVFFNFYIHSNDTNVPKIEKVVDLNSYIQVYVLPNASSSSSF